MPLIIRRACARWKGDARGGANVVGIESGLLNRANFSAGLPPVAANQTAPAELLAAAHACSFLLSLSDQLGLKSRAAGEVATTVTVTMDHLAIMPAVANVHLDVVAMLPNVTQKRFIEATVYAKTRCLISTLLCANISLSAKLAQRNPKPRRTPAKPGPRV